jgi:hypothetical protein
MNMVIIGDWRALVEQEVTEKIKVKKFVSFDPCCQSEKEKC